ncbi:glycosyltransferase [Gramella sp. BOM4]|nr:glycosyltransferase [Christiangramia bathymodioli]
MRILQLIDTLQPGGAERMAVNYANSLAEIGFHSFLVVTRDEGVFKELLDPKVEYLYLNKKHRIDYIALNKLIRYIKDNQIELIHAHGSSWFFAVLAKFLNKNLKLVWHDHYGKSEFLKNREIQPLRYFSKDFDGIISVNEKLKGWSLEKLLCEKVVFLNNFIQIPSKPLTALHEIESGFELVCIANFRAQKDHFTLFEACDRVNKEYNIRLNLIGKSFDDSYSQKVKEEINARKYIKYHGELSDPSKILSNMHVGLLSSRSEGLPLAILEYGANSLAVVCTEVGENKNVVGDHAILVPPGNIDALESGIVRYLENNNKRIREGGSLQAKIIKEYSNKSVIQEYRQFVDNL